MLRIKLVRSLIGNNKRNRATVAALGLRKMHQTVELPDNPSIRGMVHRVKHMLQIDVVEGEPAKKSRPAPKAKQAEKPARKPTPKPKEPVVEATPEPVAAALAKKAESKPAAKKPAAKPKAATAAKTGAKTPKTKKED
jgi:large subunit ribosomal protein L30